eukprot:evm.model.NODE_48559_length_26633_cov_31.535839.2
MPEHLELSIPSLPTYTPNPPGPDDRRPFFFLPFFLPPFPKKTNPLPPPTAPPSSNLIAPQSPFSTTFNCKVMTYKPTKTNADTCQISLASIGYVTPTPAAATDHDSTHAPITGPTTSVHDRRKGKKGKREGGRDRRWRRVVLAAQAKKREETRRRRRRRYKKKATKCSKPTTIEADDRENEEEEEGSEVTCGWSPLSRTVQDTKTKTARRKACKGLEEGRRRRGGGRA